MMPFTTRLDILHAKKSGMTYLIFHNYAKIKTNSEFKLILLPLRSTLTLYNVLMLIESVLNKGKNNSCYFYSLKNVYLNKKKMLYNDKTDVSVGTDINERSVIFVTIQI